MTPSYKAVTQNRLGTIEFQPNKLTENTLKWGEFPKSVFFFFFLKIDSFKNFNAWNDGPEIQALK